jgi:hypothetical protein
MEKSNMDASNAYASKILSYLYDRFPKDSEILLSDLVKMFGKVEGRANDKR